MKFQLPAIDPATLLLRVLPYLVAAVLAALLLFMAYRWAYNRGADDVRADWQAATAEAGLRFGEALAAQQVVLESASAALTEARTKATGQRKEIRDAYVADPAARDWGAQRLPDSLRGALNRYRDLPGDPTVAD